MITNNKSRLNAQVKNMIIQIDHLECLILFIIANIKQNARSKNYRHIQSAIISIKRFLFLSFGIYIMNMSSSLTQIIQNSLIRSSAKY